MKGMNEADLRSMHLAIGEAFPLPLFVVDRDVCILHMNDAGAELASCDLKLISDRRCGAVFECVHAFEEESGCGHSPECEDCGVRTAAADVCSYGRVVRWPAQLERRSDDELEVWSILVTASPLVSEGRKLVLLLVERIPELISSSGLLPVCAHCSRIRGMDGNWSDPDRFIAENLRIHVSHGICPDCRDAVYPQLNDGNAE